MNENTDKTKEQLLAELEALRESSKKREEALKESEDRLSKTMMAANDGMWDWDLKTNQVFYDARYYQMAGYDVDEFPHRLEEFQKRLHPDDIDFVMNQAQKHLSGETDRFIVEFRFKKKTGDWLWVKGRGLIVERDKNKDPLRFIGTHTDITERKQAEDALRLRDNCLSALNRANDLLFEGNFDEQLSEFVKIVGELSQASRTYIFKNHKNEKGNLLHSQLAEYVAPGVKPEIGNPELQNLSYEGFLPRWKKTLSKGDIISGNVAEFPENERRILAPQDIKAILVIPIIAEAEFWGFIGFDNCKDNTEWSKVQRDYLKAASHKLENKIIDLKNKQQLENENIRFHKTLDAIDAGVYVSDMQTHELIFLNKYFTDLFGDKTGEKCYKALQNLNSPCEFCTNNLLLDENNKPNAAYVWEHKNRVTNRWYQNRDQVIRWTDGRLVRLEVATDISECKQAEQQLHNERGKLLVTLQSIGDGVITTDTEGRVTFINRVAEQLTGWNQKEAAGESLSNVFNIINEETGEPVENPVAKVLKSGKIIGLANHTALIARDGTRRSISDSGAPILDLQGKISGVVLVFRDVTEKKKREKAQFKIEKLESVGVLAGGIAHDFNNILTSILGNISLADIYIEKENKAHPLLKEAEKASLRAKDLTQQLLTFSKGGDPVRETTSIKQVITDSADFVLHGSNVRCCYAIPEDLWLVDIDTGQMSQVIQNLVINARHAMPEGGEIKISCENIADITKETSLTQPGEKYIKIAIADHGGGIPEKYLGKIFDPYFSTKQEGSGLGLAVTHSIITKHDGHIFVQSKSGKGTTFTIYLPASDAQKVRDSGEEAQKPEKSLSGTILVMDDEEMIRDVAKEMLSRFGHEVLQAKDGKEAIAIFKERYHSDNPVDVMIMDLTIPGGMGGKEAIKEILKIDPEARAIVSSGYATDPVMANYHQYGFKAAIGKPFQMAQLNEIINSVLR